MILRNDSEMKMGLEFYGRNSQAVALRIVTLSASKSNLEINFLHFTTEFKQQRMIKRPLLFI